jgi:hypothetical protein
MAKWKLRQMEAIGAVVPAVATVLVEMDVHLNAARIRALDAGTEAGK